MRAHGTTAKYTTEKCRCDLCRQAITEYHRHWRANRNGPRTNKKRWPLQPLFDAVDTDQFLELAERLGVSPRSVHRWVHQGISDHQADKAAVTLGLHPSLIWTDWFDAYTREAA